MNWKHVLSDIDYDNKEVKAVRDVLISKWLSMGLVTERFEKEFADYLGIENAIALSNCTCALHLSLKALGIKPGDEVIVPALTFVASANSILYVGATPVFADIVSKNDLNISPEDIENKITKRTKAIIVVHYGGYLCDMNKILRIARENNLLVIEDAAHAVGAESKGKKAGTFGAIGCFSFFSNKNLVTGEGGMVVTKNKKWAEVIKRCRSHGMTSVSWDKQMGHAFSYDVTDLGYNYRINEINSALGLVQLNKLEKNNRRRKELVQYYIENLDRCSNIEIPFKDYPGESSYHIFPILLANNISRDNFMEQMKKRGIQTSIHYPPIHLFSFYRKQFGYKKGILPNTEFVSEREVTLPLHPLMKKGDVEAICGLIKKIIG